MMSPVVLVVISLVVLLLVALLVVAVVHIRRLHRRNLFLESCLSEYIGSESVDKTGTDLAEEATGMALTPMQRLDDYMSYSEPYRDASLSRRELAVAVEMPERAVAAMIRQERGQSVVEYITGWRLRHACRLLTESMDMPVTAIAEQLGFGTLRSFQRNFRDAYGLTPSEYRSKAQKRQDM